MYLLLYRGFERGLIAVVSPIFSAFVIFAVVVGLVLFRERLTPVQGLAVVLLIAGILLASSDWRQIKRWGAGGASTPGDAPGNTRGETGGETHRFTQGVPEAVCAMLTAGIFFSVLTYLARQLGWFGPILRIRIGAALVTGLLMLAIRHKPSLIHGGAYWILLAGMIDSLAYLAFNMGIRAAPAALIAPIAGSFSLVTILLVLIFFRERPAANQWAGIAAIIAGIIVMGVT
jgi:transporter family protein